MLSQAEQASSHRSVTAAPTLRHFGRLVGVSTTYRCRRHDLSVALMITNGQRLAVTAASCGLTMTPPVSFPTCRWVRVELPAALAL